MEARRWIVAQPGSREHYAVPRAFHEAGELREFFTDVWLDRSRALARRGPAVIRAMAGRFHEGVPRECVHSFNAGSLLRHGHRQLIVRPRSIAESYTWDLAYSGWFDARVLACLRRMHLDSAVDSYFGFQSGCLKCLRFMRDQGCLTMVDQAAAGPIEEEMVLREVERWPGWADAPQAVPSVFYDHLREEWNVASFVLVNSGWTRRGLLEQGVPSEKIIVVPCVFEPDVEPPPRQFNRRPFSVLFLGRVTLGKGIQYVIEAARRLKERPVQFTVVGPLQISAAAVKSAPSNVKFMGRVTRDRTAEFYRAADVFVFPTLSDGFGLTQLEAMSHGLPVIATTHCGEVVSDGADGLIVPAGDGDALAQAIARLDDDRHMLAAMSHAADSKSRQFTLHRYAQTVSRAIAARQRT